MNGNFSQENIFFNIDDPVLLIECWTLIHAMNSLLFPAGMFKQCQPYSHQKLREVWKRCAVCVQRRDILSCKFSGDYGSSALGGYSGYRIWAGNSWQNMVWTLSDFETTIQGRKSSWDVVFVGSWKCPPLLICHHQLNSCKFWVWRKKHKQMRWNICSLPISFFSEFIWQLHFSYCHRNYIAKINKQKKNEFLYEKPRCFLDWNDVCPKYSHTIYMETKWFFHNQFEVSLDYLVLVKIQTFYFFYPWIILSCSFYYPN
jgi:hypothetical protein